MLRALCARAPCAPSSRRAAPSGAPRGAAAAPLRSATASPPAVAAPPAPVFGDDLADGDFRSAEVAARVAGAGDKLWAPGGFEFSHLRAWLEASLPQVTQTEQGYFNAALVRACACVARPRPLPSHLLVPPPPPPPQAAVDHSGSDGSAKLAKDTQEYASCLWTRDVSNVRGERAGERARAWWRPHKVGARVGANSPTSPPASPPAWRRSPSPWPWPATAPGLCARSPRSASCTPAPTTQRAWTR